MFNEGPFFDVAFQLNANQVHALARDLDRLRSSEAGLSSTAYELLRALQARRELERGARHTTESERVSLRARGR